MENRQKTIRVSLRLADGEYFPVFRRGDPETRNLSLVPARDGQDEVDLSFYFHPADGSLPVLLGKMRFPDLPLSSTDAELKLDAVIGATGLLTLTVSHPESGRIERLELSLPDETNIFPSSQTHSGRMRSRSARWILGLLFVVGGLAIVFFLTRMVTHWGEQPPVPPPISQPIINE